MENSSVIYLSGRVVDDQRIGVMLSYNANHTSKNMLKPYHTFAVDNGCFSQPAKYTNTGFLTWLDTLNRKCLFATAPDVVGDADKTLERSLPVLAEIRKLGYSAGYVGQDGAKKTGLPWDKFDCFFVGGTTAWKMSQVAANLIIEAKQRGKWVHVGRVNSYKRMRIVDFFGADSCDGTHLTFGPNNKIKDIHRWLDQVEQQPNLNLLRGHNG